MKTKLFLIGMLLCSCSMISCDDGESGNGGTDGGKGEDVTVTGEVSGIWEKNSIIHVDGQIKVPKGKSLTIEEGVTVIFNQEGVGVNHTAIEFMVEGNLYCLGTKSHPVLLTVDESLRTQDNRFAGYWGGIIATKDCEEMLIDNTIIEYTGGAVLQDSPSYIAGIYEAGEDFGPHITTNNVNGRYVFTNSTFRYGVSDGIYMMGGNAIISNNTFIANGETGGEAINVKAGGRVDAAYNLIYSPNTNGFKLSSSGQEDGAGRGQALVKAYNNTVINSGWRRDGVKGGSSYIEKNALVSLYNNLFVNCKFRAMVPDWGTPNPEAGCDMNSVIDYNFYASGSQESTLTQDIEDGTTTAWLGYTSNNKKYSEDIDQHSIIAASAGDEATNPRFKNFPFNENPLTNYEFDSNWDFTVAADSPVLTGAYNGNDTNMRPLFATDALTINGNNYYSPTPEAFFGAFKNK